MKHLRILHINDQAGVSGILAKYQRYHGNQVQVICRDGYDGVGIQKFYGDKIVTPVVPQLKRLGFLGKILRYSFRTLTVLIFYLYIASYSRNFDIVHIHSNWLAYFFVRKPKIIEFHGDDIRRNPSKKWWIDRVATDWFIKYFQCKVKFLVSTPDLLNDLPCAEYLPNPVDTEHFKHANVVGLDRAVFFNNWYEKKVHLRPLIVDTVFIDRTRKEVIMYPDMPTFLGNFEFYFDRKNIHSLSKTALEALAMGLKVIRWDGEIVTEFPRQHDPWVVAEKVTFLYTTVYTHK